MKIYKFIVSLYIGAAIICLIVTLCITSCDGQIYPLRDKRVDTIDLSFYTSNYDIFTVQGSMNDAWIISERSGEIYNGTFLECISVVANISWVNIGLGKFLYEYDYDPKLYWSASMTDECGYSIKGCPEVDPAEYSSWVAQQYEDAIEDLLLTATYDYKHSTLKLISYE